ncbi:hypothetical protein LJK87_11760 [Paenibacillus sp. P25]|nr:hypothetical protein LJK87_11760 [Paenibacillus sp. P25]
MKWIGKSRLRLWFAVMLAATVTLSGPPQGIGPSPANAGTGITISR